MASFNDISSGAQIKTKLGVIVINSIKALPAKQDGLFKLEVNFETNGTQCSLQMNDFLTLINILH